MIRYNSCIRCGSESVDKVVVNTTLKLNYPPKEREYFNPASQRIISPTDALVCKECGHIELFFDWDKANF